MIRTTDCMQGWFPVLPSLCNPWHLSHQRPICRTGVCYSCVDVELIICIPRPAFLGFAFSVSIPAFFVMHFLVPHFPVPHFVVQTCHRWSRIFRSCIFPSRIFSAPVGSHKVYTATISQHISSNSEQNLARQYTEKVDVEVEFTIPFDISISNRHIDIGSKHHYYEHKHTAFHLPILSAQRQQITQ